MAFGEGKLLRKEGNAHTTTLKKQTNLASNQAGAKISAPLAHDSRKKLVSVLCQSFPRGLGEAALSLLLLF